MKYLKPFYVTIKDIKYFDATYLRLIKKISKKM